MSWLRHIVDLTDEAHCELEVLASTNGCGVEAKIRAVLEAAVAQVDPQDIIAALATLGARFGGIGLDITRDPGLARWADFD